MDKYLSATERPASSGGASERVAAAQSRAQQRLNRQRGTLRPLGWAVMLVVLVGALNANPTPGFHGKALGVTVALALFVATLALAITERFTRLAVELQTAVIALMGAASAALAALQPRGATELAGGAAVWMAVTRLPFAVGVALAALITVALDVATALAGNSSEAVLATTLLCALLGLMAYFVKQARASQDRTEMLMARLQDAREQQMTAAAIAERGRIAAELHDVLAHSLSGAAIQLQGARMLAERAHAEPRVRASIERATELVKDGLTNARQAVGALRGEALPTIAELDSLVAEFRMDMDLDATLRIEGVPRQLPANANLALYRGVQEALTNVARYAPGASTEVVVRYAANATTISVENQPPAPDASERATIAGLSGVGGGRGLAGMRERIEGVGGSMRAGPTENGWRVDLDVPA